MGKRGSLSLVAPGSCTQIRHFGDASSCERKLERRDGDPSSSPPLLLQPSWLTGEQERMPPRAMSLNEALCGRRSGGITGKGNEVKPLL